MPECQIEMFVPPPPSSPRCFADDFARMEYWLKLPIRYEDTNDEPRWNASSARRIIRHQADIRTMGGVVTYGG